MDLEGVTLNKVSQRKKNILWYLLMCRILKKWYKPLQFKKGKNLKRRNNTNEPIYKTETYRLRKQTWLSKGKEGGGGIN